MNTSNRSEKLTKPQLIIIKTLFSKLRIPEETQRVIITGFSSARTASARELTWPEATQLIRHLNSLDPDEKKADTMRRLIIAMAHEIGWNLPGTKTIDMDRLNGWCVRFGYGKKALDAYTLEELPRLATQFEMGPYKAILNRNQ